MFSTLKWEWYDGCVTTQKRRGYQIIVYVEILVGHQLRRWHQSNYGGLDFGHVQRRPLRRQWGE